jgi:glycosyltransferase involved in cell wall biosynthesis
MTIVLEVIICTCNRASELDRMLAALAFQSQAKDIVWSVLVVDNGSTDATARVVESWRARGSIPGLRSLFETERGLTPARLRGVRETDAEWIAFVDDDNLLATDWIAGVGQAVAARPEAGGFGGRVIIDWISPCPDYLKNFGWCFAEQDHGAEMCEMDNLTGAGMVLRREALEASGWVHCSRIVLVNASSPAEMSRWFSGFGGRDISYGTRLSAYYGTEFQLNARPGGICYS